MEIIRNQTILPSHNILIVTYNLDKGGVEEVILTYAKLLPVSGYNVTVACLVDGQIAREIAAETPAKVVYVNTSNRFGRFVRIWRIARAMQADIVHNHACWYGLVVGFLVGAKRIETIHNTYFWFKTHERILYGLYLLLANRIIAVSEAVKDFSLSFFPFARSKKFAVIYNGVNSNNQSAEIGGHRLRDELGISSQEIVIGFTGRLTEQKGLEFLIEAAAHLLPEFPTLRLVIVGDGELRGALESKTTDLGLSSRVLFTGHRRDIDLVLAMFDIFVLPSLWEGLPVSVLEAMAAALPVIATRVGGIPEVVEHGVTGFVVEPRNVAKLTDCISQLLKNPEHCKQMGEMGRKRALERFSGDEMVRKTIEVYDQLLGSP